jgi:hypothetical protein
MLITAPVPKDGFLGKSRNHIARSFGHYNQMDTRPKTT